MNLFASNTCRFIETSTYLLTRIIVFQTKDQKTKAITFNERTPEYGDDERATSAEIGNTIRYALNMYYDKIILIAIRKMLSIALITASSHEHGDNIM